MIKSDLRGMIESVVIPFVQLAVVPGNWINPPRDGHSAGLSLPWSTVTRDPPSSGRIQMEKTQETRMYKNLGNQAGNPGLHAIKQPGVEFAPPMCLPAFGGNLWLKNSGSAQASSTVLRRFKPRSSPYVVYADWFEQGRHVLPNLTDGSHVEHMNSDMEPPLWEAL